MEGANRRPEHVQEDSWILEESGKSGRFRIWIQKNRFCRLSGFQLWLSLRKKRSSIQPILDLDNFFSIFSHDTADTLIMTHVVSHCRDQTVQLTLTHRRIVHVRQNEVRLRCCPIRTQRDAPSSDHPPTHPYHLSELPYTNGPRVSVCRSVSWGRGRDSGWTTSSDKDCRIAHWVTTGFSASQGRQTDRERTQHRTHNT